MKICKNCGYKGDVNFCPNCGTEMLEMTESLERDSDLEEEKIEEHADSIDDKKTDSEDNAITESELYEGEEKTIERIDENNNDELVEEGEARADSENTSDDVEKTDDKETDAVVTAETAKEGEKVKPRKKLKKILLIVAGIVAAIVIIGIIGTVFSKGTVESDMDDLKTSSIHSLEYQYPAGWDKSDDNVSLDYYEEGEGYFRADEDGNYLASMAIYYIGEDKGSLDPKDALPYTLGEEEENSVLNVGETEVTVKEYKLDSGGGDDEDTTYDAKLYTAEFEKDYSKFFVVLDAVQEEYDTELFNELVQKIKIDKYKNPRTAKEIEATYDGDKEPGTVITTGTKDVSVKVKYDEGDVTFAENWSLSDDITIEEGKTNEATVSCHGLTCKLKVKGRKPLEITAKYSGNTKAGTRVKKKDIKVTVKYDNGEKKKVTDWEWDRQVKLKAGKTSTVKIEYNGLHCDLDITCTTLSKSQYKAKCISRNYKDQLRHASYGKHIKIYGQVLQDCGYGYYRISSSGGYDDVYMVSVPLDADIVEDDWVTVYGETAGIYEYETVMGASQKVPEIDAKYVYR